MTSQDIQTIYAYHCWAVRRVLAASARVSDEQFRAHTAHSFGSLRGTLVHTLDSEHGWRMLCQHHSLSAFRSLQEDRFPTVGDLVERWNEEERAMRDYLAQLTDADLGGNVRYTTEAGERARVLWHCLWHVVNHGTQHLSEAAAILTEYGASPGSLDFTVFLNEQPSP